MKLNKYILMLGLGVVSLTLTTSCSDRDEEITEMSYSRLFSALDLEARVQNQIDVRLSWTKVSGAASYIVNVYESANQEGDVDESTDNTQFVVVPDGASPVKTINGITDDDIPVVISGLQGETRYILEVIAVDSNGGQSKGICTEVKTSTEQTLRTVLDSEIEANSVTLRWNATDAEGCIITVKGTDITHTVTAAEAAAQACVIGGLTGETTYTVVMTSPSGKTRGTTSFTTAVDLGGAISVTPDDDLNDVIEAAEAGSTLALWPGTYECLSEDGTQSKIKVTKSLSIKAVRPADRPIIKGCIHILNGASLEISQVVLDGAGSDGSQAFDFKTADVTYDKLIIDDCEIKNYTKGFFYINVAAKINTITVNNCLIHEIECSGGDMFDSRAGGYDNFNLTNSTIYNSAASRDMIRMDDKSSVISANAQILVDHCTLYKVGNGDANYRLLYVRFGGNSITWTNNIVAEFNNKRGFANQKTTSIPTFSKNYYYNTLNLVSLADGNTEAITFFDEAGVVLSQSPFKDAENADFTITNEDISYYGIGDPRWY